MPEQESKISRTTTLEIHDFFSVFRDLWTFQAWKSQYFNYTAFQDLYEPWAIHKNSTQSTPTKKMLTRL